MTEDFESGVTGANLTSNNTNFDSTDFSNAVAVFSMSQRIKNSQSALIALSGTSGRASMRYNFSGLQTVSYLRWYQYIETLSANTLISAIRNGSIMIAQLRLNSDRTVRIYNNNTTTGLSTQTIPLSQWIRFEWQINTDNGSQELRAFTGANLNSNSANDAFIVLSGSVETVNSNEHLILGVTAASTNYSAYYDAFATQSTGWIGADSGVGGTPNLIIASAIGVGGVWRPVTKVAIGVGGVWRPLNQIGFGQDSSWRPAPDAISPPEPTPQQRPYFIHMPWQNPDGTGIGMDDWPALIAERQAAGWGTGVALYSSGQIIWNSTFANFFANYPQGIDVFAMPVNPAGAAAFCSNLNAAQRSKIWWSNGQEREDNDNTTLLRAAFKQRSIDLWNEIGNAGYRWNPTTRTGVRCCVEMNGYVTHQGTHGGVAAQIEMVDTSVIDFMGWSTFGAGSQTLGANVVNSVADAMEEHWPNTPWGTVAGGVTVPADSPLQSAARVNRATGQRNLMQAAVDRGSETLSHYDVWHFSTGDYGWKTSINGGPYVIDTLLNDVLVDFADQ